jgi:hypothetical protein
MTQPELILEQLTSHGTWQPDWQEVVRLAAPPGRRAVRTWIIALSIVAVGSTAALAFAGVRGVFFGTPAPKIVQQAFARNNAMRELVQNWARTHHKAGLVWIPPRVNGRSAHGVIAVETSDGPLLLWAAPGENGRQCWFIEFARDQVGHKHPTGGGGCDSGLYPATQINWGYGGSVAHATLRVLSGRLYVNAATVDVVARDRDTGVTKTYRLPVVDRYFLAAFPRSVEVPSKLTALDSQGHVLAQVSGPRQ